MSPSEVARLRAKRKEADIAFAREHRRGAEPGFELGPRSETKQRMLTATLNYLRGHGLSDLSLRQLAEKLGTSHRLLSYHFGTREGLLVAVVEEIEREQRRWLESLWERDLTPMRRLQMSWKRTCDPELDGQLRLFVEIYGQALQGRAHTEPLLDTLIGAWLAPIQDVFERIGLPSKEARAHGRLHLATMRGLMLDVLTTGDIAAATEAWELHVAQYDAFPDAHISERGAGTSEADAPSDEPAASSAVT